MHTPSPWRFEYHEGGGAPIVYREDPTDEYAGEDICTVGWVGLSTKTSLANARLICAAPDLLDCLRHLADEIDPERMVEQGGGDLAFYLRQARDLIQTVKGDNS